MEIMINRTSTLKKLFHENVKFKITSFLKALPHRIGLIVQ